MTTIDERIEQELAATGFDVLLVQRRLKVPLTDVYRAIARIEAINCEPDVVGAGQGQQGKKRK